MKWVQSPYGKYSRFQVDYKYKVGSIPSATYKKKPQIQIGRRN
jgi:hypothetical protein